MSLRSLIGGGSASSRSNSSSLLWKNSVSSMSVGDLSSRSLDDSGTAEFTLQKYKYLYHVNQLLLMQKLGQNIRILQSISLHVYISSDVHM